MFYLSNSGLKEGILPKMLTDGGFLLLISDKSQFRREFSNYLHSLDLFLSPADILETLLPLIVASSLPQLKKE